MSEYLVLSLLPKIAITGNESVAVLEILKPKVVLTVCVRNLEWTLQKVECDPVIKSSVIMHLCKSAGAVLVVPFPSHVLTLNPSLEM